MSASDPEGLDTPRARGVVRDALGGLRNLLGLVRSIRVGPQAIADVVPDVHASCTPMREALLALLAELPASAGDARGELGQNVLEEAVAVETALGGVRGRALRAKDRLQLERALSRGVRNVEAGFRLLSILLAARHATTVPVEIGELASGEGPLVSPTPLVTRSVEFSVHGPGGIVHVDPRLTAAMLAVAGGMVVKGAGAVRLDVEALGDRRRLRITSSEGPGDRQLTVLEPIPPTRACLVALAELSGCEISEDEGAVCIDVGSAVGS